MEVIRATHKLITEIINKIDRQYLPFNEYKFITDEQLKEYYFNTLICFLDNLNSELLVAVSDSQILGIISYTKNEFDSEMFGFECYRIADLIVFKDSYEEIKEIIDYLLSSLETNLVNLSDKVHLSYSLNNNVPLVNRLFNSLVSNNFFYLHTLLTFCYHKGIKIRSNVIKETELVIRIAEEEDAQSVADLAAKSFEHSRFHMDPFLDDKRANKLLRASAVNSILKGFVDVMYVAELDNQVVGYFSGKKNIIREFDRTFGQGIISAVDSNYRGKGIFSALDVYLFKWVSENSDFSEYGTYLVNYPIHKTFINKGLGLVRGSHQFSKLIQR